MQFDLKYHKKYPSNDVNNIPLVKVKNICFEKTFFSSTRSEYPKNYVSLNVVKKQPSRGLLIEKCPKNM